MSATDEVDMVTALFIIIILDNVQRWINRNPAPRLVGSVLGSKDAQDLGYSIHFSHNY